MSDLKQYLIDEFVEDYQVGHLTRRDALKRLAGLTGSLVLADTLLAACTPASDVTPTAGAGTTTPGSAPAATAGPLRATASVAADAAEPTPSPAPTAGPDVTGDARVPAGDPAIVAGDVTLPGEGTTLLAYQARTVDKASVPIVLVCHENRGLTEHIRDVTRRVAKAGYAALAVDLLSREGGTASVDSAAVPGVLGNAPPEQFVRDFQSALDYMQSQPGVRADRAGMTGFCFGGGVTWRCATRISALRAAVPFYGPHPPLEDVPGIQAAVLAIYGGNDQRINAGIPAIEGALKAAGKTYEIVIYPNAAHAFHNDTGPNYNAEAAREAWAKTLAWFDRYLKT